MQFGAARHSSKRLAAGIVRELSEGGPGSGDFGHAGRPGEVGGSGPGGGSAGGRPHPTDAVVEYHGTAVSSVSSIFESGLKVGGGKAGGVHSDDPDFQQNADLGVFVVDTKDGALGWAVQAARIRNAVRTEYGDLIEVAILKVVLPGRTKLKTDPMMPEPSVTSGRIGQESAARHYYISHAIARKYIEEAEIYKYRSGKIVGDPTIMKNQHFGQDEARADGGALYVPILATGRPNPASGVTESEHIGTRKESKLLAAGIARELSEGGPGSGYFGHAGRLHQVGGSAPGGGSHPTDAVVEFHGTAASSVNGIFESGLQVSGGEAGSVHTDDPDILSNVRRGVFVVDTKDGAFGWAVQAARRRRGEPHRGDEDPVEIAILKVVLPEGTELKVDPVFPEPSVTSGVLGQEMATQHYYVPHSVARKYIEEAEIYKYRSGKVLGGPTVLKNPHFGQDEARAAGRVVYVPILAVKRRRPSSKVTESKHIGTRKAWGRDLQGIAIHQNAIAGRRPTFGLPGDNEAFSALRDGAEERLQATLADFQAGDITKGQFEARAKKVIGSAFEGAYEAGAQAMGAPSGLELDAADDAWLGGARSQEYGFLRRFADAIDEGTGIMDPEDRMGLYADTLDSMFWAGQTSVIPDNAEIVWNLGETREHCPDCLELVANSPYSRQSLPTVPRAGSTVCLTNCGCYLTTEYPETPEAADLPFKPWYPMREFDQGPPVGMREPDGDEQSFLDSVGLRIRYERDLAEGGVGVSGGVGAAAGIGAQAGADHAKMAAGLAGFLAGWAATRKIWAPPTWNAPDEALVTGAEFEEAFDADSFDSEELWGIPQDEFDSIVEELRAEIPDDQPRRFRAALRRAIQQAGGGQFEDKAKGAMRLLLEYNADQPRDPHGRWAGKEGMPDSERLKHLLSVPEFAKPFASKLEKAAASPPAHGVPFEQEWSAITKEQRLELISRGFRVDTDRMGKPILGVASWVGPERLRIQVAMKREQPGAEYHGYQPGFPGHTEGMHLYNLTRDIVDAAGVLKHPKGSTVTASTLRKYGFQVPEPKKRTESTEDRIDAILEFNPYHDEHGKFASGPGGGGWWHGTPSGELKGGSAGLHVGTRLAAKQALEARIGVPAEGEWDGTREYGRTLIAGQETLNRRGREMNITGFNADAPAKDYYPADHGGRPAHYGDGTPIPMTAKPDMVRVEIIGKMTNTPDSPHADAQANALIRRQTRQGKAVNGYFYKNIGEDEGSVSAVVPNAAHLRVIGGVTKGRSKVSEQIISEIWDPEDHPRGEGGRFADKGTGDVREGTVEVGSRHVKYAVGHGGDIRFPKGKELSIIFQPDTGHAGWIEGREQHDAVIRQTGARTSEQGRYARATYMPATRSAVLVTPWAHGDRKRDEAAANAVREFLLRRGLPKTTALALFSNAGRWRGEWPLTLGDTIILEEAPGRAEAAWEIAAGLLLEFNPHHAPAGTSGGGQFTSGGSGDVAAGEVTRYDTPEIVRARAEENSIPSTHMIHTPEREVLRDGIVKRYLDQTGGNVATGKRMDIVLGPPGAGKSTHLVKPLAESLRSRIIDSDDVKTFIPEYDGGKHAGSVHKESSEIADRVVGVAIERGENIVYPLTGKNPDRIRDVILAAKGLGYSVHLHLVDLPAEKGAQRAVERFYEKGRFVDPAYVLDVGDRPRKTYEAMRREVKLDGYSRYDNDVPRGHGARLVEASAYHPIRGPIGVRGRGPGSDVAAVAGEEAGTGTRRELIGTLSGESRSVADEILSGLRGEILEGGQGSGNFGHAGRPGLVGGSGAGGGGTTAIGGTPADESNVEAQEAWVAKLPAGFADRVKAIDDDYSHVLQEARKGWEANVRPDYKEKIDRITADLEASRLKYIGAEGMDRTPEESSAREAKWAELEDVVRRGAQEWDIYKAANRKEWFADVERRLADASQELAKAHGVHVGADDDYMRLDPPWGQQGLLQVNMAVAALPAGLVGRLRDEGWKVRIGTAAPDFDVAGKVYKEAGHADYVGKEIYLNGGAISMTMLKATGVIQHEFGHAAMGELAGRVADAEGRWFDRDQNSPRYGLPRMSDDPNEQLEIKVAASYVARVGKALNDFNVLSLTEGGVTEYARSWAADERGAQSDVFMVKIPAAAGERRENPKAGVSRAANENFAELFAISQRHPGRLLELENAGHPLTVRAFRILWKETERMRPRKLAGPITVYVRERG